MAYENLYIGHANALDGSLFFVASVKKAALLLALDNDIRPSEDVEADLDPIEWTDGDARGTLKSAVNEIEKALVHAIDANRIKMSIEARDLQDKVDVEHTLLSIIDVEKWAETHDLDTGEWWAKHVEDESDFARSLVEDIEAYRIPKKRKWVAEDDQRIAEYRELDPDAQIAQFQEILQENNALRSKKLPDEPSVTTKERTSLLILIAVLAKQIEPELDKTPHKKAEMIVRLAETAGVEIGVNTVRKYLKEAPEALERRAKG